MFFPGLLFFIIFHYLPMIGIVVAFKDYSPYLGFAKSPWVGLQHFRNFFGSYYAWRIIRNTLLLNVYSLIFAFPAPILLALTLNELRGEKYKRFIQTITYFPYFMSMPIVAGLVVQFLTSQGIVNTLLGAAFDRAPIKFLERAEYFRGIYVSANIWHGVGFGAIIYLAAIASVDPQLYEAAVIDGAGRMRRMWHITLAGIAPTIIILFLLSLGAMLSVSLELVLLLYNPLTYETADVIDTFVYRRGLGAGGTADYGLGTAVGLFKGVIGMILIVTANRIAKIVGETSLW